MTHGLDQVVGVFSGANHPWAIGGGWAIDLHLGEPGRRRHADVDVVAYQRDAEAVRRTLAGWDLHRIAAGRPEPWGSATPAHQIWARPASGEQWAFEVLFEEVIDGTWHYRRNPAITLAERDLISNVETIPTLHLGVSLLYKAKRDDDIDLADLEACLPVLGMEEREWLGAAVASSHGDGHRWVEVLVV